MKTAEYNIAVDHDDLGHSRLEITKWDYLLMYFVLLMSGNPFFQIQHNEEFLPISVIIPIVYYLRTGKFSVSYRTILIFTFMMGFELFHAFWYKLDYSLTFFKILFALLLGCVTMDILRDKFIEVLTRTMVFISLASFVFVVLCYVPGLNKFLYHLAEQLFPLEKDYKGYSQPTLLLFTFHPEFFEGKFSYTRNAGIFWESGAFAVYLNITLFLYYSTLTIGRVKDLFDKKATILIIALASTTSTMGAISLVIQMVFFTMHLRSAAKYFLFPVILVMTGLAFTSVEFLGDKITKQLGKADNDNNRFGSALMDWENIRERPLIGWSRRIEVVFGTDKFSDKTHRPNGLTNFLRSYGLIYFCFYFIMVYQGFARVYNNYHPRSNPLVPAFGILLLLMVSFSELIFDLVFQKGLLFLYGAYRTGGTGMTSTAVKPMIMAKENLAQENGQP